MLVAIKTKAQTLWFIFDAGADETSRSTAARGRQMVHFVPTSHGLLQLRRYVLSIKQKLMNLSYKELPKTWNLAGGTWTAFEYNKSNFTNLFCVPFQTPPYHTNGRKGKPGKNFAFNYKFYQMHLSGHAYPGWQGGSLELHEWLIYWGIFVTTLLNDTENYKM